MNLSTMNNTKIIKKFINNSVKNILFKIHDHGLFIYKALRGTYDGEGKKQQDKRKRIQI